MAEVTNNLNTPVNIRWYNIQKVLSGYVETTSTNLEVDSGGVPSSGGVIYIGFDCTHFTFQVQYRRRRRYTPSAAAALGTVNGDLWEDWSDWVTDATIDISGQTDTSSQTEVITWLSNNLRFWTGAGKFAFEYDWEATGFDQQEYEVRARTYDELSDTCSAWAVKILTVSYKPYIECTNATEDFYSNLSAKDLLLRLSTNWQHGNLTAKLYGDRYRKDYLLKGAPTAYFPAYSTDDVLLAIPNEEVRWDLIRNGKTASVDVYLSKGDTANITLNSLRKIKVTLDNATPSTSVSAPAYYIDGSYLEVNTTDPATSTAYTAIFAGFTWQDADSGECTATLEPNDAIKQDKGGFANYNAYDLGALPYDVDTEIRIVGVYNSKWNEAFVTHNVASNGRYTWIGEDGTEINLVLRLSEPINLKRQFTPEQETVKLAGRSRDVSRYGTGGSMSLDLEGAILLGSHVSKNTDVGGSNHANFFQALTANDQDFIFLAPGGVRATVQINSVSFDTYRDYETVSISMTEVD